MKKNPTHPDQQQLPLPHKLTQNFLNKKNKQFELLYRQRDESVEENPIESIIFVKSKPCKLTSNDKKIKVHQQFKKIMSDLNAHVNQHKKSHKSEKKCTSTASTQHKTAFSTKKSTKQTEFIPKKSKVNEKDQNKILKAANKSNQFVGRQKSPNIQTVKSPKKNQKTHLSPKSKNLLNSKQQKFQKQNFQTKRANPNEKLERKKSPQQKTNRKPNFSEFQQDSTAKKHKFNPFGQPSYRATESQAKPQIKRNVRSIPLRVQQYILIQDNFQRIRKRSLCKLQTKLLSTYRNNCKQYENKIFHKESKNQNDIVFEKLNKHVDQESDMNFIQRSSADSDSNLSEKNLERSSQIPDRVEIIKVKKCEQNSPQKQFVQKVILIQKWWKKMMKIEAIKEYLFSNLQNNESFKSHKKQESQQNFTTPVNLPSAKSLQFSEEVRFSEEQDRKFFQTNEEMSMLKNQNQIIRQKKNLHQKILTNLLTEKKITKDDFDNKMALVQREYEKQLKQIMSLYRLIEFGSGIQNHIEDETVKSDIKIISGENEDKSCQDFDKIEPKNVLYHPTPESETEEDDIPMKIYKIGDKITSQMQNYIEEAKKKRETSQKMSNDFICEKYNKKTNQLGEEYFEDFESDSSNDQSPHKMLSASNFEEFESQLLAQNHGSSFEPNAHFIKMLEQYKENEGIKMKIDQRVAVQMGAMRPETGPKYALDTSILGIHQFLVSFFKFYLHYYKDEFLRFINMPYGYQPEQRLKFIQGYEDTSDELSQDSDGIIYGLQYIISDDVFDQFSEQYYAASMQTSNEHQKAIIECSKIHDRALFECFNEALNNFRPYYSISGPPYIWNCSQKTLTFYFISEENINQVFEKTQYRVMKWASGLLGLYVQGYDSRSQSSKGQQKPHPLSIQQIMSRNQTSCHPLVFQKRQQNLIKQQRIQLIESMNRWGDIQQQLTSTLYELSSVVLEELAKEFVLEYLIKYMGNELMEEFY